jgi:hypothetical protein
MSVEVSRDSPLMKEKEKLVTFLLEPFSDLPRQRQVFIERMLNQIALEDLRDMAETWPRLFPETYKKAYT